MIGKKIAHYRILEKIGQGGMGEVYLAEDTELRRKVAIKFLPGGYSSDPDVLARFKREAQAAAALNHPNIITIHHVGEHEGRPYIVMAHVEGAALSDAIAGGRLPLDRVLDYAIQIADGLSKAHQAGVIHRDIKPANILIDLDGHAKILDFGLAKLHGVTKLTSESSTLGTIYYMSPEQARSADVDHRSDIFSLGSVLYEMIAGQVPFRGDHAAAVMYAIANEEPPPLARYNNQVSPELERIVAKALAKDPGERYQSAADLAADLRRERRRSDASHVPVRGPGSGKRRRAIRVIAPAAVVFVAVLALLILKPFQVHVGSDNPATAAANTFAVMYFDNLIDPSDEKRLGEIITNVVITDLSESRGVNVLSSQRLYDLLKMEGKEGVRSIDRGTATSVAKRAGAKWMLLGSVLQVEPAMVVTSQVVDVASGAVVSSQRVSGAPGDDVFAVTDRLLAEIRSDMSMPGQARHDAVTAQFTHSEEAYRYYLEGVEYDNRFNRNEAKASFLKAIEHDSTFAMAYQQLALPYMPLSMEEKIAYADKAMRYSTQLPERERMFIEVTHAFTHDDRDRAVEILQDIAKRNPDEKEAYVILGSMMYNYIGDAPAAIRYFRRAIEIDPYLKTVYNGLAYAYNRVGDTDESIWAINKYIELAPDEPNPYDTRGDLYAQAGRIEDAIASYKTALEKRPDYEASIAKLGHMYRAKRNYATAESYYRQLLNGGPFARSDGRLFLACLLLYQGRLASGLEQLEQGLAADRIDGVSGDGYNNKLIAIGRVHEMRGDLEKAIAASAQLPRYETGADEGWDGVRCEYLAKAGDFEGAARAADALRRARGKATDEAVESYARGWIAFAQQRYDDAAASFEKALAKEPMMWNRFPLALSYLEGGRLADAVDTFARLLAGYEQGWGIEPIWAATMHYYAGIAYERAGSTDRARERYEAFLTIWKDADPGIDIVEDAKRRLQRLRRGS